MLFSAFAGQGPQEGDRGEAKVSGENGYTNWQKNALYNILC